MLTFAPSAERIGDAPLARFASVALCGPWRLGEFRAVRCWLDETPTVNGWDTSGVFPTLEAAIEQIDWGDSAPELVFCAQRRPREVDVRTINRLAELAPLTRLILVVGSWCEGEWRTGTPPTGTWRLFWHEVPGWCRDARNAILRGECPAWSLPLPDQGPYPLPTSSTPPIASSGARPTIAIGTPDYSVYQTLCDVLDSNGLQACWLPYGRRELELGAPSGQWSAGIWDGGQLDARELGRLTDFCRRLATQNASVIAMVDFPRAEHLVAIQEAGAVALLAKPYRVSILAAELQRLIVRRSSASAEVPCIAF